jgi:hypothetical protein
MNYRSINIRTKIAQDKNPVPSSVLSTSSMNSFKDPARPREKPRDKIA